MHTVMQNVNAASQARVSFVFWVIRFHHLDVYCYKLKIPTDLLPFKSDMLGKSKRSFCPNLKP